MKSALLCVCAILFASAVSAQVDSNAILKELKRNRNKWRTFGLRTYKLKERQSCFCTPESLGPFDVTVVNDQITEVTFSADSNLPGSPNPNAKNFLLTIEGAFTRVEESVSKGVARATVKYDANFGYITNFFIDFDERIADEEQSFTFELLTPVGPVIPLPPVPTPPVVPVPPVIPVPVPTPSPKDPRANLTLKINRQKWKALGPKSYKYRLRRLCFCFGGFTGPFLITVKDGKIVDVVFEGEGPTPDNIDVPTIDGLFDIIEESIPTVDSITVEYDRKLGFPLNISIDRIKLAIDDEITYTAEIVEGQGVFDKFPGVGGPFKNKIGG
ncbi:hypothetical protein BSKO_07642 [Bryopsis sp. KO-2023]|nr:hypothetical protein BSKO_07642 [Bryopsis sp. KO-2023]